MSRDRDFLRLDQSAGPPSFLVFAQAIPELIGYLNISLAISRIPCGSEELEALPAPFEGSRFEILTLAGGVAEELPGFDPLGSVEGSARGGFVGKFDRLCRSRAKNALNCGIGSGTSFQALFAGCLRADGRCDLVGALDHP